MSNKLLRSLVSFVFCAQLMCMDKSDKTLQQYFEPGNFENCIRIVQYLGFYKNHDSWGVNSYTRTQQTIFDGKQIYNRQTSPNYKYHYSNQTVSMEEDGFDIYSSQGSLEKILADLFVAENKELLSLSLPKETSLLVYYNKPWAFERDNESYNITISKKNCTSDDYCMLEKPLSGPELFAKIKQMLSQAEEKKDT